ncbi:hypothetical protein CDD81_5797 [Ophiocordyceps australis]|uniref:ABC transporter n=1 Tax=Ophiocordyceps australis TaxID=1399860 RepID=A0A2C5Y734_9HYPO|nr:hypothetical protein CDD81_5797 [Ophiocordyceps australis]
MLGQAVMARHCPPYADDVFGPIVDGHCRGGFDFTLLFQQAFLSIIPASIFIVLFPLRVAYLATSRIKAAPGLNRYLKLAFAIVLAILQIALLVLWSRDVAGRNRATLPAAIVNAIVALEMVVLSAMEDARSICPSAMINVYLLFTLILDAVQTRTLWLRHSNTAIAAVFSASVGVKAMMLVLEGLEKRGRLFQQYQQLPPESTTGVLNRSLLWWLNSLFAKGHRNFLAPKDLFQLDEELTADSLSARMQHAWSCRHKPERRFEFPIIACKALWWPIASAFIPRLFLIVFTFAQPFLISRVLDLLTEPDNQLSRNTGYGLILAAAVIYLGLALSTRYYNHSVYRFMAMFRGAAVTLIYNHMLTLSIGDYDDSAVVTLMSTDVDRIVSCLVNLNEIWARVIEVVLGVVLLAWQLGWVCLVPVLVVIFSFFGSAEISKTIGARQKVWIDAVQKRITVTASMLAEMRSVKMMGLSTLLTNIVQDQRVQETDRMAASRWSIVWQNVVQNLPWALAPSLTFVVYVAQAAGRGEPLGTTKAFTSLSIITLLSGPASKLLSAVPSTAASLGCFDRIQDFLVLPPRVDDRLITPSSSASGSIAFTTKNLSLRPAPSAEPILKDVTFTIQRGSLTMVIGPVGSGKTTLLRAMLGEIVFEDGGSISVASSRIALCVQVPWLPNTTIRQAVSGYMEDGSIDSAWYQKCLSACALDHDISLLPKGDGTQIGSASTTLSGGQRHRIALARAIYARADMIVLDDILGALDTNTQAVIMSRLFGDQGLLKKSKTTVVLATHAIEYLKYANQILVVSDGRVEDRGSNDQTVRKELISVLKSTEPPKSEVESKVDEATSKDSKDGSEKISEANQLDDLSRAPGDLAVYRYYLQSVGWPKALAFVAFVFLNIFCSSFSQIWLKWWSDVGGGQVALYMTVYIALALLTCIGEGGYVWAILILISPHTARKLHQVLLRVVMRAPQSFFSATDSGSILNRFSQDMTIIESQLPIGVLIAVSNLFSSVATAALVATGSFYMIISVPFLIFVIWALQNVYLRTSRQLRLLDLEARSPLFSHFLETSSGLTTIRAFGWESRFSAKNEVLLNYSQRPHYIMYCIQRWLELVLDLIVGAQAVLVVGLAVGLRRSSSPGLLGVSLNNTLAFSGSLSSLVSGWTMLETSLGSISRLMHFEATVKPEDKSQETYQPSNKWPERGAIEFRKVTAVHSPGAVGIRGVSLKVKPGQKIGICGRTGSGKSSLLASLARLLEIDQGVIIFDGVDIATVPRETIRERLLILPQDPLILSGSVRLNVDPEGRSSDEAIKAALDRVGLWTLVESRGLDVDIANSSLSRGQQQLLALARAVVKKQACDSRILLLDEATSNVDADTDAVLQRVVREDFAGCTRVTVAHRIDTIMDSDVIVVMDGGSVVEIGIPAELKAKAGGWFAELIKAKD